MKLTFLLLSVAAGLTAAHGATTDPSAVWTVYSGYQTTTVTFNGSPLVVTQSCTPGGSGCTASAITGDGNVYSNGLNGVSNCVIHISGTNPTYDATCGVGKSRSPFNFNFLTPVGLNYGAAKPSWGWSGVTTGTFLNVSHVLNPSCGLGCTQEMDYTTRFTSALGGGSYHLRMNSAVPQPDMPAPSYWGTYNYNDPYQTALVHIHHCPDTTTWNSTQIAALSPWCNAGPEKETWYAYPDAGPQGTGTTQALTTTSGIPAQVGTLVSESSQSVVTTIGEYSTPFFFKIQLQ